MSRRKLTKQERIDIHKRMDEKCGYCGQPLAYKGMQIDHILPIKKGGTCDQDNLIASCRSCNHRKSTLDVEQFRQELLKSHERLKRDSVTYKNALRFGLITPKNKNLKFYFENKQSRRTN